MNIDVTRPLEKSILKELKRVEAEKGVPFWKCILYLVEKGNLDHAIVLWKLAIKNKMKFPKMSLFEKVISKNIESQKRKSMLFINLPKFSSEFFDLSRQLYTRDQLFKAALEYRVWNEKNYYRAMELWRSFRNAGRPESPPTAVPDLLVALRNTWRFEEAIQLFENREDSWIFMTFYSWENLAISYAYLGKFDKVQKALQQCNDKTLEHRSIIRKYLLLALHLINLDYESFKNELIKIERKKLKNVLLLAVNIVYQHKNREEIEAFFIELDKNHFPFEKISISSLIPKSRIPYLTMRSEEKDFRTLLKFGDREAAMELAFQEIVMKNNQVDSLKMYRYALKACAQRKNNVLLFENVLSKLKSLPVKDPIEISKMIFFLAIKGESRLAFRLWNEMSGVIHDSPEFIFKLYLCVIQFERNSNGNKNKEIIAQDTNDKETDGHDANEKKKNSQDNNGKKRNSQNNRNKKRNYQDNKNVQCLCSNMVAALPANYPLPDSILYNAIIYRYAANDFIGVVEVYRLHSKRILGAISRSWRQLPEVVNALKESFKVNGLSHMLIEIEELSRIKAKR